MAYSEKWIQRLFYISFILLGFTIYKTFQWGYLTEDGPKRWCGMDTQCCGLFQSPIDIRSAFRVRFPDKLTYINYDVLQDFIVTNDGHTAMITLSTTHFAPMLTGGPLTCWYVFEEAHFHWGLKSDRGSEHTINGHPLPMEMHIVHKNIKYSTLEEAYKHVDGLAIISVLFKVQNEEKQEIVLETRRTAQSLKVSWVENVKYRGLVKALTKIPCKNEKTPIKQTISLSSLLPSDHTDYVTYFGSLTNPPCAQSVIWIILETFAQIGESQMLPFRNLRNMMKNNSSPKCGKKLVDNFRPTQKLRDRVILEIQ